MTRDEMFRHAELASDAAHLVLEKPLKRFAKPEVHFFGQTAHVVVALDDLAGDVEAFDAVRIDGALTKPACALDFTSFGVENLHKVTTNDFALLLRVGHALQVGEETLGSVHADDVKTETLIVVQNIAKLVLAQHAVVHKNTSQIAADGTVEQHGCNRTVHAAGKSENDFVVAQLFLQRSHGAVHKRGRTPVLHRAADVDNEVAEKQTALDGVEHLGVELHAPKLLTLCLIGCVFHLGSRGNALEVFGNGSDGVAVGHPNLRTFFKTLKQGVFKINGLQIGAPIFSAARRLDLAAVELRHILRTIANAQDGIATANLRQIHLERFLVIDAERRA